MIPNASIVGWSAFTGNRPGGGSLRSVVAWPDFLLVPCQVEEFGYSKIAILQSQKIDATRGVKVRGASLRVVGISPRVNDLVTLADRFGANAVVYEVRAIKTPQSAGRIGTSDEIVLSLGKAPTGGGGA